jgi:hypothetical protein
VPTKATPAKTSSNATPAKSSTRKRNEPAKEPYDKTWTSIGPSLANELLSSIHEDQRRPRDVRVEQYASDMRRGHWRDDTEDAILVDWYGRLIDGQNRLRAIVESGKTISFWLVRGVDPAVMEVKDTGAARTVADSLRISGRGGAMTGPELAVVGTIARRQLHWEAGRRTSAAQKTSSTATHADIGALLDSQPDIFQAAKLGVDASRASRPAMINASLYGFFILNAIRVDNDMGYRWHSFWITPSDIPAGSPIRACQEKFMRSKMAQGAQYGSKNKMMILNTDQMLALLVRAWNLFLADRKIDSERLVIARGKLTNENFPVFLDRKGAAEAAKKMMDDDEE